MFSEVYDIEVLKNLFTYTGKDRKTKQIYQFVIHNSRNDYISLMDHLLKRKLLMIGYNSIKYDYPIIHHMIIHYEEYIYLTGEELASKIYEKSQEVIDMEFSAIANWNVKIPQMDLMKIWHLDGAAKLTSLKSLEFAMNFHNIEDSPYNHDYIITTPLEIENTLSYNLNDVEATDAFLDVTLGRTDNPLYKGKNKIQLRLDIQKKFNLNCLNFNDVKIGDEINKLNYIAATGRDINEIKRSITPRNLIFFRDCIPDFINFESEQLTEFLNRIKEKVISGTKGGFSENIIYKGVKFNFGQGGLHTDDRPRKIIPNDNEELEDRDCASMYPTTIINQGLYPAHLGIEWLNGYKWTFNERIKNKGLSNKKKNPDATEEERQSYASISEAFKLSLNGGGFGKTGEESSWQYDPLVTMRVTISNQLSLLMLAEKYLNNGIKVISCNTDGILILYNKEKQELVYQIDRNWEKLVGHTLEYASYKKFIQTSVNDYVAQKLDGELKEKGDFEIEKEFHKNPSMKIVPIALSKYFIDGISVKETIENHKNIFDFCLRLKTDRNSIGELIYYEPIDNEKIVKELSKTTRYYISNNGGALYKYFIKNKKLIGVNVNYLVTTFNRFVDKPINEYDVNYKFYIKECNKIIDQVEPKQLTLF